MIAIGKKHHVNHKEVVRQNDTLILDNKYINFARDEVEGNDSPASLVVL